MNRLSKFVAGLLLLLVTLTAAATEKGLLWKVEHPEVATSYLFGTMHSGDSRVIGLAREVEEVLDGTESFTMEMVLNEELILSMSMRMLLDDGTRLSDLLDHALYQQVVTAMSERGMPEQAVDLLKPWAVFMTLSMPPDESGTFLDLELYQRALAGGKTIHGLESMEEQLAVFDEMPRDDQIALLQELMKQYGEFEQNMAALTEAYLSRDLDALVELSEESAKEMDKQLRDRIMGRLVDDRNRKMAERMMPRLREGNAFIAVGALHLPGESGLITLLRERGYQVTPFY